MNKIVEFILKEWKPLSSDMEAKNAFALSRNDFEEIVQSPDILNNEDIVFISIENTESCVRYYEDVKNGDISSEHVLPSSERVLNVNFDDTVRSIKTVDGKYEIKSINPEQGKEIYDFLCKNKNKNIIVHCSAGVSRSQGVIRSIYDMFHNYEECLVNKINPCLTPNYQVVYEIKRNFYNEEK